MSKFSCFQNVTIVNDSFTCLGDSLYYGNFTFIDLSFYGGDTHTYVTSDIEVIDKFKELGLDVVIKGCEITIMTLNPVEDIPSGNNPCIHLDICNGCDCTENIDFTSFDFIDLSVFGGNEFTPVTNEQDIINSLTPLVQTTTSNNEVIVEIEGCCIKLINYTGETAIIPTISLPTFRPVSIVLECDEDICVDLPLGDLSLVSIQGQNPNNNIEIEPGIIAYLVGSTLCFNVEDFAVNQLGQVTYEYTNGVSTDTAIINYTVDETQCDLCSVDTPAANINIINSFCGNAGTVSIDIQGGYPPYNTSINGENITGNNPSFELFEGTYNYTITDSENCTFSDVFTITQDTPLTCSINTIDVTGCSTNDGILSISANGGTPLYTYTLNGQTSSNSTFSGLMPGNYVVTVTDGNGCSTTCSAIINDIDAPTVSASITGIDCQTNRREVTLNSPNIDVEYSLNGTSFTGNNVYQIPSGNMPTFYIRYINAPDCVSTVTIDVPAIEYGCTDPNSCDFDVNAECDNGCANCEAPLVCNNGVCSCPTGTYQFIKPDGDILCLNTCNDSTDCQITCPDGSSAISCTECYCFDIFFALDVSGSMNTGGKLNAMKAAMIDVVNYVSSTYPNVFNFYIASFNNTAQEVIPCTNVNPTTATSIINSVNAITAGGGTTLSSGINLINSNFNTCSNCDWQTLIVLGDGAVDSNGISSANNFLSLGGDQVTTISFGSGASINDFELISQVDGTTDNYIADTDNISTVIEAIVNNLCVSSCITMIDGTQVCSPCSLGQTFNINTGLCE